MRRGPATTAGTNTNDSSHARRGPTERQKRAAARRQLNQQVDTHETEEQINIVLSGQVQFRVGDDETVLGAGGVLLMPRHVEHELWNDTDEFAQIIEIYTPPGMEQNFAAAGAAAIAGGNSVADADDYATGRSS